MNGKKLNQWRKTGGKTCTGEGRSRRIDEAGQGAQEGGRGPDRGVWADVEDPLKVASPGRLLG